MLVPAIKEHILFIYFLPATQVPRLIYSTSELCSLRGFFLTASSQLVHGGSSGVNAQSGTRPVTSHFHTSHPEVCVCVCVLALITPHMHICV